MTISIKLNGEGNKTTEKLDFGEFLIRRQSGTMEKVNETKKLCCPSPDKYKNIISNSLKFYACRNCGADLGDIVT